MTDTISREIHQLCVDVAEIKTMLSERKDDQVNTDVSMADLSGRVRILEQFHATAKDVPRDVADLKKFMWKLSGAILFVAVLIESLVLYVTRAPSP